MPVVYGIPEVDASYKHCRTVIMAFDQIFEFEVTYKII